MTQPIGSPRCFLRPSGRVSAHRFFNGFEKAQIANPVRTPNPVRNQKKFVLERIFCS